MYVLSIVLMTEAFVKDFKMAKTIDSTDVDLVVGAVRELRGGTERLADQVGLLQREVKEAKILTDEVARLRMEIAEVKALLQQGIALMAETVQPMDTKS